MQPNMQELAKKLVRWHEQNMRPLPWREDRDPYHVWVSEIMLQQTRIEAVIEHYYAFMAALPTLADLAAVEEEKLLKLWEGLGYYSRARNLKKAAVKIMEDFGGVFPHDYNTLRTLPGIGDYTAGAIASICFDEKVPAVDGNVLRVLARVKKDKSNVLLPETKKKAEIFLKENMPDKSGSFNEGLMELGETICLPNGLPLCADCPIREHCAVAGTPLAAELPVRIKALKRKTEEKTVLIVRDASGNIALEKRENKGLLAGLYQLPNVQGFLSESEIADTAAAWGLTVKELRFLENKKHIFTHITWQMRCVELRVSNHGKRFVWSSPEELESTYALPTAFSKCLK